MVGIVRSGDHQLGQVLGTRHVLARQARGVDEVRVGHPERGGLGVHGGNQCRHAAGIIAAQGMGGAILGRHQRQVHQVAAGQDGADGQARKTALGQIRSRPG